MNGPWALTCLYCGAIIRWQADKLNVDPIRSVHKRVGDGTDVREVITKSAAPRHVGRRRSGYAHTIGPLI